MPDLDPEDAALGAALSSSRARRRRRGDDDEDDGNDVDTNSAGSLWTTGLVVVGALVLTLALALTFAG